MNAIGRLSYLILLIALVALTPNSVNAGTGSGYLIDHGVAVYYAIIPAEMIRGHAKQHPEATMHGGVPNHPHAHHLMVALFRASSLERIADADVTAAVGEVGLAQVQKQLEPFSVAGALTYGNYFDMRPRTQYRIRVDVRIPGSKRQARVELDFQHE